MASTLSLDSRSLQVLFRKLDPKASVKVGNGMLWAELPAKGLRLEVSALELRAGITTPALSALVNDVRINPKGLAIAFELRD